MAEQLLTPAAARQLRGLILTLIYINHKRQRSRLTSTVIWGTLKTEGYQFSRNDVLTVLQDLRDRDYVRFNQMRDDDDNHIRIFAIEITARGRDLYDKIIDEDPAVQLQ